jgi:hypothetical protein
MNWARFFMVVSLLLLVGALAAYFIVEGFQNRLTLAEAQSRMSLSPTWTGSALDSATICSVFKSCGECLDTTKHPGVNCGWCPDANICIPRSGQYRIIPQWFIDMFQTKTSPTYDLTKDCKAKTFIYNKFSCTDTDCSSLLTCLECATTSACGWCASKNTCVNKAALAAQIAQGSVGGSGGSGGSIDYLCSESLIESSAISTCPPPTCTNIRDCGSCTQTTGCGWCKDSNKCMPLDANQIGAAGGSAGGSMSCPQGSLVSQLFQCPCAGLTKCTDCTGRPGCGYCVKTSKCVNLKRNNLPDEADCTVDGMAISNTQCNPGAKLGNVRSERGDYKPGDDELNLAQDNSALSGLEMDIAGSKGAGVLGTGSGAVSPPKLYTTVSGNGLVRRVGQSSVPFGISKSADLQASPLEDYVKLLVRSELASEGIPMNEPFQVNEAQALGNAEEYLKKTTKGITE